MAEMLYGLLYSALQDKVREISSLLKFAHYEWSNIVSQSILAIYLVLMTKHLIEPLLREKISFSSWFQRQVSHRVQIMWLLLISG